MESNRFYKPKRPVYKQFMVSCFCFSYSFQGVDKNENLLFNLYYSYFKFAESIKIITGAGIANLKNGDKIKGNGKRIIKEWKKKESRENITHGRIRKKAMYCFLKMAPALVERLKYKNIFKRRRV